MAMMERNEEWRKGKEEGEIRGKMSKEWGRMHEAERTTWPKDNLCCALSLFSLFAIVLSATAAVKSDLVC